MLCATCRSIFQPGAPSKGPHHICYDHLVRAAESGCKLCISQVTRVKRRLEAEQDLGLLSPITYDVQENSQPNVSRDGRLFEVFLQLGGETWRMADSEATGLIHLTDNVSVNEEDLSVMADARKDMSEAPWRVRLDRFVRSIPSSTGDPDALRFASEWLSNCLDSHKNCESIDPTRNSSWIPSRLLDVTEVGKGVCLCTREDPEFRLEPYATLSHHWGSEPFFVLTDQNLQQLRDGIDPSRLPKSFGDAIHVCRHLSIKYLWIDSLCILQRGKGSSDDWQKHVAEMQFVYLNCILNISVDHATSPHQGAFSDRNPNEIQPTLIPWQDPKSSLLRLWTISDRMDHSTAWACEAVSRRGWTLQERVLSPRILHFTCGRIMWECGESGKSNVSIAPGTQKVQSEYFPNAPPAEPYATPIFSLPYQDLALPSSSHETKYSLHDSWDNLIDWYSQRDFTYPSKDKLAGLAGLAQRFSSTLAFGTRYVAGHFLQDLPRSLLWNSVYIHGRRSAEYRAPSWSWASHDGRVSFCEGFLGLRLSHLEQEHSGTSLLTINDAHDELVQYDNQFGQVRYAELVATGFLIPFINGVGDEDKLTVLRDAKSKNVFYTVEKWDASSHDSATTFLFECVKGGSGSKKSSSVAVDWDNAESMMAYGQEKLYLVPVMGFVGLFCGLILARTDREGVFERLGMFSASKEAKDLMDLAPSKTRFVII